MPPTRTKRVVEEAAWAGIKRVCVQPGSESETAIRYCEQSGVNVIHGSCIVEFTEPAGFSQ